MLSVYHDLDEAFPCFMLMFQVHSCLLFILFCFLYAPVFYQRETIGEKHSMLHSCFLLCVFYVSSSGVVSSLKARVTDAVQFGDGFGLAGAVIMHLLGQRQQFELLDFSYHVLNVNNFERCGRACVHPLMAASNHDEFVFDRTLGFICCIDKHHHKHAFMTQPAPVCS